VPEQTATVYEQVGGHEFFQALVSDFYTDIADDDFLRRLYPEEDLGPAEDRLRMFLEQYWGGPTDYSATRGHPRLRARHSPYRVDERARNHWLVHMRNALDNRDLPPELDAEMWDFLVRAAHAMVNVEQ